MKKKRILATIASTIIGINTIPITSVNAKVIEPEIVKTETWTTSYYIDDDMATLYPYIDCQADIYNDGTVKVYFWNTHEWDGFDTVYHNATLIDYMPVREDSVEYSFKYNNIAKTNGRVYHPISEADYERLSQNATEDFVINDNNVWDSININYYPKEYTAAYNSSGGWHVKDIDSTNSKKYYYYTDSREDYKEAKGSIVYHTEPWCWLLNNGTDDWAWNMVRYNKYDRCFRTCMCSTHLVNMSINEKSLLTFTPTLELTDTYNFKILGHEFTISPEILSANIIAEPILTDVEKRIQELEKENAELKKQNENLLNILNSQGNKAYGDMNNDGFVDGRDASILLTYYAKTSVGYTGTLDDFIQEQDKVEN